jgi:hypothetical protein
MRMHYLISQAHVAITFNGGLPELAPFPILGGC